MKTQWVRGRAYVVKTAGGSYWNPTAGWGKTLKDATHFTVKMEAKLIADRWMARVVPVRRVKKKAQS